MTFPGRLDLLASNSVNYLVRTRKTRKVSHAGNFQTGDGLKLKSVSRPGIRWTWLIVRDHLAVIDQILIKRG